jgi:very-short-patch-repair endonuclease
VTEGKNLRNPKTQKYAKELRLNLTKAEIILWKYLKSNKVENIKFRRQFVIEPFIVDFAAVEIKLIIEIDGATHSSDDEIKYDISRQTYLEAKNWQVMRVSNHDIYNNLSGILEVISQNVYELKQCKAM